MGAATLDLNIYQGDEYRHGLLWRDSAGVPIDLTGYTAKLHCRAQAADDPPIFELTEVDGITLGGAAGTIDLLFTPANTVLLPQTSAYDLQLTLGAAVTTIIAGKIKSQREITRP